MTSDTRTRATYLLQSDLHRLWQWAADVSRTFRFESVYLVGSALETKDYRDVDIRVMLDDDHPLWLAVLAQWLDDGISVWGQTVTGLPIDFQLQRTNWANAEFDGRRHALFDVRLDDMGEARR